MRGRPRVSPRNFRFRQLDQNFNDKGASPWLPTSARLVLEQDIGLRSALRPEPNGSCWHIQTSVEQYDRVEWT